MSFGAVFALTAWFLLLMVWMPLQYIRHRRIMRSLTAVNKGHRFYRRYKTIQKLSGKSS